MPNKKFQNALRRIEQKVPPIWMMRQAGRYHAHYQKLKQSYSFEQLCKTPALAAQTAMGPIEDFDFDAAILFSDILFPLEAMGMDLSYNPGPQFAELLTQSNADKLLSSKSPIEFLDFQAESIHKTLELLPQDKSMIGFIGGPWTLLSYAMGSNKQHSIETLSPFHWSILQDKIIPLLHDNIALQLAAGAEIIMIFDSSANQISDDDFNKYIKIVFTQLVDKFPQKIGYYAKDGVDYNIINQQRDSLQTPLAGIGIDAHANVVSVLQQTKSGFVQGNFSELMLSAPTSEFLPALDKYIDNMLQHSESERAGWICGLGHGILKTTPEENVRLFVQKIRAAFA